MLRLVVIAAAIVCGLGAPRTFVPRPGYPLDPRIVGGSEVAIEAVPYQLSFQEFGNHLCGATIISADWAVTAAHCADIANVTFVDLRTGSDQLGEGGIVHAAEEMLVHKYYDSFTLEFDIALIRVSTPFEFSATTAAIALADVAPVAGTPAFVSGWGTTSSGGGSLPVGLSGVEVPIVEQSECDTAYVDYGGVTEQMICAGLPEGGVDSCQGDSGGPLAAEGQLVGIVSWGLGCALPGYPGVYANVAALRSWITENAGV